MESQSQVRRKLNIFSTSEGEAGQAQAEEPDQEEEEEVQAQAEEHEEEEARHSQVPRRGKSGWARQIIDSSSVAEKGGRGRAEQPRQQLPGEKRGAKRTTQSAGEEGDHLAAGRHQKGGGGRNRPQRRTWTEKKTYVAVEFSYIL